MEEFVEKDSFEFGDNLNNGEGNFGYNDFVQNDNQKSNLFNENIENNNFNPSFEFDNQLNNEEDVKSIAEETTVETGIPINLFEMPSSNEDNMIEGQQPIKVFEEPINVFEEYNNQPIKVFEEPTFENPNFTFDMPYDEIKSVDEQDNQIDNEFLEENPETFNGSMNDNFEYDVVAPTMEPVIEEKTVEATNIMSDTPIEELNKLTEYKEEKISATDIKSLFNRVGNNVQEASDIFMKNTEMKEKLDAKFEELKQLQATIENAKKTQYDEINSYKEEVYSKLTEKKNEIEERINKLKEFQDNLEKEKEEFEKYKKEQTDEIEQVQKEVQDAYDTRREELSHIEDVLRKQKDALDEERNQLSLDKIQYEADKNELANNLLKFNQIVDSFTIGMESTKNEE